MKIIVIDDELNSRELMEKLLQKYCPEVSNITLCESAVSAIFNINKLNPDLIFLDIEMPNVDGFDLLDSIDTSNQLICFATGYDKYAIKAINYGAFGYLLKPIDIQELKDIVSRAHKKLEDSSSPQSSSLLVNDGNNLWVVQYDEIVYIEAYGNTAFIVLNDKKILSGFTLNQLEELLPSEQIFRTHRSYMVNLDKVEKVQDTRTGIATMETGDEVPIASRRVKEFVAAFKIRRQSS